MVIGSWYLFIRLINTLIMNRYLSLYNRFISSRGKRSRSKKKPKGYELHHIIPTSIGGTDTVDNRIALTSREHFIAHLILAKCYEGENKSKMVYALHRMANGSQKHFYKISSRQYDKIRTEQAEHMKKRYSDPAWKRRVSLIHQEVWRRKQAEGLRPIAKKRPRTFGSTTHRQRQADAIKRLWADPVYRSKQLRKNGRRGPQSAEHRAKISASVKQRYLLKQS